MWITYTPEGEGAGERQEWEFLPGRVRSSEAVLIEKRYGAPWDRWLAAVHQGDTRARRVLLWHLQKRTHHTMRFEDVPDFCVGELLVEMSVAELVPIREQIEKSSMAEGDRELALAALDAEITDAMVRDATREASSGKASSPAGA